MRATFFSFALAAALAFAGGGSAMAQHHGHGGGFHGGGYHGGGLHGGGHVGYVHGGYHHGGFAGHHGYWGGYRHWEYGGSYWPYYAASAFLGAPYYSGYSYRWPTYTYAAPSTYDVIPPVTYTSPVVTTTDEAQPVTMTVMVPKADAEVFLNGQATTSSGTERVFQSPPVNPGSNYAYSVTARWMENGKMVEEKRDVQVQAGENVSVDFRTPGAETVLPPEIK